LGAGGAHLPAPSRPAPRFAQALNTEAVCYTRGMSTEEFKVSGDEVIKTVKKLIAEGNARRIIIKREDGSTLSSCRSPSARSGRLSRRRLPLWGLLPRL